MPSNSEFSRLLSEYNEMLQRSKRERVNRLDLSFKEGSLKAIEQARIVFGIDLDLTEQSLQQVEFIMEELHNTVKRLDPTEKWIDQIVRSYSGYIGYIIQSRWQGEWRSELEYPIKKGAALKIRGKDFFLPYQVRQRLLRGQEYNIVEYYRNLVREIEEPNAIIHGKSISDPEEILTKTTIVTKNAGGSDNTTDNSVLEPDSGFAGMAVAGIEPKQDFNEVEWIISVNPVDRKNYFLKSEIESIFNPVWRETTGFGSGLVKIYGLPPGEIRWCLLDQTSSSSQRYSKLEIRCNLLAIYYGKRRLNPKYLEVYYRTVEELFAQFRFEVNVTPQLSFEEGVARIKDNPLLK